MRRPFWILALLLAMVVAGGFAWLGQWQMGNAIRIDADNAIDTETPVELTEVTSPGVAPMEAAAGKVVTLEGSFVPDDFLIMDQRMNQGENGYWVVGNLLVDGTTDAPTDSHLAVSLGWAADREVAERALAQVERDDALSATQHYEGRYMPTEGTHVPAPDEDPHVLDSMAPEYLVNLWEGGSEPAYSGFLVMHAEAPTSITIDSYGLSPIDSVTPEPPEKVNWLNVFYAIEWVVFAGFALFFWYRLTRDAWEKEHELMLLAESDAEADPKSSQSSPE